MSDQWDGVPVRARAPAAAAAPAAGRGVGGRDAGVAGPPPSAPQALPPAPPQRHAAAGAPLRSGAAPHGKVTDKQDLPFPRRFLAPDKIFP